MKKFKFCKEKLKTLSTISIGLFVSGVIFSNSSFATDINLNANFSEEYKEWMQNHYTYEENDEFIPRTYSSKMPDELVYEENSKKVEGISKREVPRLREIFFNKTLNLDTVSDIADNPRYNLAENIPIRVKHQGTTSECWAFSLISCMESNIAIRNNIKTISEVPDFSERHMDYSTSKTFTNGTNEKGYERELGAGGIPLMGLSYLSNGTGAVLEDEMPFEDNEDRVSLSEIDKPVDTTITGYKALTGVFKEFDQNGNVQYSDGLGNYYSQEQLKAVRKVIKENIVKNGAVTGMTAGNHAKYYSNPENPFKSSAYFCNDPTITRDHAITIVGWDDNYSRDNFNPDCKPSTDGAYIVLNSYGEESFYNGYIYVSYEDVLIESDLYSIEGTEKLDYDKIYQEDYYGGLFSIGTTSSDVGYISTVFSRQNTENEYLTDVGVTVCDYVDLEIYVNPSSNLSVLSSLTKVGEIKNLDPGYHKIEITPTKLTGSDFVVVIKQKSKNNQFYFSLETAIENTVFASVKPSGNSFYSVDGNSWQNINGLSVAGIDMTSADVCIKAFTKNEEAPKDDTLYSNSYKIYENSIMNVRNQTSKLEFLNNINTNMNLKLYTEDGKEITDDSEIIKTGMKLRAENGKEYVIAVRGDISCDGKISLIDISKFISHYIETEGFILEGAPLMAADLNCDNDVTVLDFTQIKELFMSLH